MQFYGYYAQPSAARVRALVDERPYCELLTTGPDGLPHLGLFNHRFDGDEFLLHLNRADEQVADLRARAEAVVSVTDVMALIPSYWVDERDGGAATMYYRHAEFRCRARLIEAPGEMTPYLTRLMDHFQPEGGFDALDHAAPVYARLYKMLVLVALTPVSSRTKWKVGQNRPADLRQRVVEQLKARGRDGDLRAAAEVQATVPP